MLISGVRPAPKIKLKPKPKIKPQLKIRSAFYLRKHETVYYTCSQMNSSRKYIAFDLDGTIIRNKTRPRDASDWSWAFPTVLQILREYHQSGYQFVIFSNQSKIGKKGGLPVLEWQQRIDQIGSQLVKNITGIGLIFYLAGAKDYYRKPMTGMWDLFLQQTGCQPKDVAFYCGDASGRVGDFNITDLYFARNIGLNFKTPEHCFQKNLAMKIRDPYQILPELQLGKYLSPNNTDVSFPLPNSNVHPMIIIMVGAPASGKSTVSRYLMEHLGFNMTYLSTDQVGSLAKLRQQFELALKFGQSIIIDNTNPRMETRKWYLKKVFIYYQCYCYYFNLPKRFTYHLNSMRTQLFKDKKIPLVAYHRYYKELEVPKLKEGFHQIMIIDQLPITHPEYWYQYDLK